MPRFSLSLLEGELLAPKVKGALPDCVLLLGSKVKVLVAPKFGPPLEAAPKVDPPLEAPGKVDPPLEAPGKLGTLLGAAPTVGLPLGTFPKVEPPLGTFPKVEPTLGTFPKVGPLLLGAFPKVEPPLGTLPKIGPLPPPRLAAVAPATTEAGFLEPSLNGLESWAKVDVGAKVDVALAKAPALNGLESSAKVDVALARLDAALAWAGATLTAFGNCEESCVFNGGGSSSSSNNES